MVARELRLIDGADGWLGEHDHEGIAGIAVAPARSGLKVRAEALQAIVTKLPVDVDIIAFVDDTSLDDTSLDHTALDHTAPDDMIARMVADYSRLGVHAVVRIEPATQAPKRIEDGCIAESIERSSIASVHLPEIIDRHRLERAVQLVKAVDGQRLVNPASLIASAGGTVAAFEDR